MKVFLIALVLGLPFSASAQKVAARDTLRPQVVKALIDYIAASQELDSVRSRQHRNPGFDPQKNLERWSIHSTKLAVTMDMQFYEDLCQYRLLNDVEKREMFDLRLRRHPELRRYASTKLKRDVLREGFGFHVSGELVNDYYPHPTGVKQGEKLFEQVLKKHGVKPC